MRTTEQLRYGGVLEAVRVARSGFPVRLGHVEFYQRYRGLANPFHPATKKLPAARALSEGSHEAKRFCESLLGVLWDPAPQHFPAGSSARKVQGWLTWLSEHSIPKESVQVSARSPFSHSCPTSPHHFPPRHPPPASSPAFSPRCSWASPRPFCASKHTTCSRRGGLGGWPARRGRCRA